MAFSLTADAHILAWRSSSLLQQESRSPKFIKHQPLQLRARHAHPNNGFCTSSLISKSETGRLTQKHETPFSFCLKRNGTRLCFRVVAQAGRSKPKFPQPIQPRKRRRVKPPSGQQPDPAGNIRRRKSSNTEESDDPYVRHPPDYYKFGPYGPYDYKADVEGTMIPWTSFEQHHVFMWSTIKDLEDQERVDIEDACICYHNRVRLFDESVGLKFFYIFVRTPYHVVREPPWRQWTLVSEITVESGEDLDKETLMFRLHDSIRSKITQHTAWFRPDLVHVRPKRRHFQIRFEPQMDFIRELRSIFTKSAGEPDEVDGYYGVFCRILGLDVNASHEDITSNFEASSEKVQLACLEHLLSNHPVELLYSIPYPNRSMWTNKQSAGKSNTASSSEMQMNTVNEEETRIDGDVEDDSENEEDEDETESEDWDNLDDKEIEAQLGKGFSDDIDVEPVRHGSYDSDSDEIDLDDEEFRRNEGGVQKGTSILKADARPYTYVNFIREMVMLRDMILERKRQSRQIQRL